jgi:hypothetical protein
MSNDLITGGGESKLPAFMHEDRDMGVKELRQYIVPPRIKIVQPQSGEPFKPQFNEGDVVLVPQMVQVAPIMLENGRPTKNGTPFHFIPVFFFPEWCCWNSILMKGSVPAIRERSFDPMSMIAQRSRSEQTRFAPQPEQPNNPKMQLRFLEHLNFVVVLLGENEVAGIPTVISFLSGEHKTGSTLSSLITMRRCPIFGCQFEAAARYRTNAKGQWYGLDITNPSIQSGFSGSVTDENQYNALKKAHLDFKKAHADRVLVVDHDDEDVYESTSAPSM